MVEANPANPSRVAWYCDSQLAEGDRYERSSVLVILEVEPGDSGIYFYEAENRVGQGRAEQGAPLQVYYELFKYVFKALAYLADNTIQSYQTSSLYSFLMEQCWVVLY